MSLQSRALLLCLAVVATVGFGAEKKQRNRGEYAMDFNTSYRYALLWAAEEGISLERLSIVSSQEMYGQLGSLAFEYSHRSNTLILRGTVSVDGKLYHDQAYLFRALKEISQKDPALKDLSFELYDGPWQKIHKQCLYLRMSIKVSFSSDEEFLSTGKRIRKQAFYWSRTGLTNLILTTPPPKR
jgi:hypothetical protein